MRDSDGTLILTRGEPTGGTATTIKLAAAQGKPCLVLDLLISPASDTARTWIEANGIRVLNIAGPRESGCPGIREQAVRSFCGSGWMPETQPPLRRGFFNLSRFD